MIDMSQCSKKYGQLKKKILFAKANDRNKYAYLNEKTEKSYKFQKEQTTCPHCGHRSYTKTLRCIECGCEIND